ncbi:unnamed protein product [Vicia faba]|uniref:Uncharacterized protein n=1 Tax=Vicia faba TaxID=3906 RepID=A0AAV0ZBL3_VICFA|nr:unnamed protein product [Vicia faba]
MGRRTSTGLVLFAWLGKRELPECKAYLAFTQLYDTSCSYCNRNSTACLFKTATSITPTADTVPSCTTFFFHNSFLLTLAFFLMKGPKTQGRAWNGAESLDLEDGIELYFLFLIREEGHRLIGGSIQDNYRAECLERAERFPFSRVTWPIGLLVY